MAPSSDSVSKLYQLMKERTYKKFKQKLFTDAERFVCYKMRKIEPIPTTNSINRYDGPFSYESQKEVKT